MSDLEFEIIDNLYFVQRFEALIKEVGIDEKIMQKTLLDLFQKGWVKVMDMQTDEEILDADVWTKNYSNYFYLATKKGLFAHNTK
ncbi:transporter [uncultured Cytophaga sp.]|mgnify:FL=1|uniref:transporter n=1 Tax=uncultured Cytophaga sp. TaxID=160238 RepID=UPI002616035D|nr:transporter [uncultured Cytophaga sp.]